MYASVILVYWDYIYCHAAVYQDVSFSLRRERKWQLWAEGWEMSSERNGERDIERERWRGREEATRPKLECHLAIQTRHSN